MQTIKDNINVVLFDDQTWQNLLPLTFTRPVSEIRVGILKIRKKWEKYLNKTCSFKTKEYLTEKYPLIQGKNTILINSSVLPNRKLVNAIQSLKENQVILSSNIVIAANFSNHDVKLYNPDNRKNLECLKYKEDITKINYPWDIFRLNGQEIREDFTLLTTGRTSTKISKTNNLIGEGNIFVEKGAQLECTILNASAGPIYIGRKSEIMEGSVIRGPFALCEHSVVKLSAKIYGPTTIGPHSKVGGEINNSVIQGYSNKAHDGFLGNSVIGEWCNIGADTNNSNLKNNYVEVKLWNYKEERFINTGLQFCGLIMGDHSKCGINTMFNTGTVVGVSANIFGSGFPRNFIPSFSLGGAQGYTTFNLSKALEVAQIVMERRDIQLDEVEKGILAEVFNRTDKFRKK